MRIRELLKTLAGRDPDDIIALGVCMGPGELGIEYNSAPIAKIKEFDGIVLLYTPENERYALRVARR